MWLSRPMSLCYAAARHSAVSARSSEYVLDGRGPQGDLLTAALHALSSRGTHRVERIHDARCRPRRIARHPCSRGWFGCTHVAARRCCRRWSRSEAESVEVHLVTRCAFSPPSQSFTMLAFQHTVITGVVLGQVDCRLHLDAPVTKVCTDMPRGMCAKLHADDADVAEVDVCRTFMWASASGYDMA